MKTPAVFLDRDGTIIEDRHYVSDPADVVLLPGAAEAIRRFRDAGYRVVIVSNQSGIARGLFDQDQLAEVHARIELLLEEQGVHLDGAYYCPFLDGPEAVVERYRRDSEMRKPKPGMLLQAARELDLDLVRSWMIGNAATDVQAGRRAGCKSILIADESASRAALEDAEYTVADLMEAADMILGPEDVETIADDEEALPVTTAGSEDRILHALNRIHDRLEGLQREKRQEDFSVLRLVGALAQMLAIVVAVWGLIGLFDEQAGAATARFALACFCQLVSISSFAVDRFR